MPGGWHPPQYWALAGAVFFATWAVVATSIVAVKSGHRQIQRRRRPPRVILEGTSGATGAIVIRHIGGIACSVKADGRILRAFDKGPNPKSEPFEARIIKGSKALREIVLENGDWARIHIADVGVNTFNGNDWLNFHHGGYDIVIGNKGVQLEVVLIVDGHRSTHCFDLTRIGDRHVSIAPSEC